MSDRSFARERGSEDIDGELEKNGALPRGAIEDSDEDDEEQGDDLDGKAGGDDGADDDADDVDDDDADDDSDDSDDVDDDDDSDDDADDDSDDDADGDADDTPIADLLSDGVQLSFTDADFADALDQANTAFADGAQLFSLTLGSDLVLFVDNDDDPGFDEAIILVGGSLANTALVDLG